MLNPYILVSTLLAEREREMVESARMRALARSLAPRPPHVNVLRLAAGRLLLRAGIWMVGPAAAAVR